MWVIDRFEENIAVLENTQTLEIIQCTKEDLPAGAREGDALFVNQEGKYTIDIDETKARSERIRNRFDRLRRK